MGILFVDYEFLLVLSELTLEILIWHIIKYSDHLCIMRVESNFSLCSLLGSHHAVLFIFQEFIQITPNSFLQSTPGLRTYLDRGLRISSFLYTTGTIVAISSW